jgi:hypothetical protein
MPVGDELSQAIALATAWATGEIETWTVLAQEAITGDPGKVLRRMSFIITQLAETIAEQSGGIWTTSTVLQHLALDAEEDDGDDATESS